MYPSRKMIKQWFYCWINEKKIDQWFQEKNIFFILSIGRSGTKFLSNLLNKAPNSIVVHEPVRSDFRAHQIAFHNETHSYKYIKKFRKKEIFLRLRKKDFKVYGEVNSVLRRHCKALKELFPNAIIIHLVRDGRDVVRSIMSRNTMTTRDPNTRDIYPKKDDPWNLKWHSMSRFEKLCWYWKVENEYLDQHLKYRIRFEDIISDYNYFSNNLLKILNLDISKETWENEIKTPKNITLKYTIPHWKDWDETMLNKFNKICGEMMRRYDYIN
ncbi:MAG: sulfotransferase family protein [Promethearchaeota archaeon]